MIRLLTAIEGCARRNAAPMARASVGTARSAMLRAFLPALAAASLMLGCATVSRDSDSVPARPPREAIRSFQIEGRIAVRRGAESVNAGIDWRHGSDSDEILLSGPLGQGIARLSANTSGALLETADRARFEATDLETLSTRIFGTPLPISGIAFWVLGRSATSHASASIRRITLEEQGWTIEYLAYESEEPNALPVLIRARREDVDLRLKVDAWSEVR